MRAVKYESIVFLEGDSFDAWYDVLEEKGDNEAVEHLAQFDYGEGGGEILSLVPYYHGDRVVESDDKPMYQAVYNWNLRYVSLYRAFIS